MDGGDDSGGIQKTNDIIRRTYEQLVNTRNTQLQFMSKMRRSNKEFGYVVTPDLVLQYNYVHQLMKSFRTGMPPDICVKDGGITCSNLSVLTPEQITGGRLDTFPATLPAADDSDYLASRIVDLLDRPVATSNEQDITVNVRDEFAANIRTLNLLFEERYKLCQAQGDKLKNELTTVRQQLEASRAAASKAASNNTTEQTIRSMREQISRYETQLRIVREQMEALREMNENAIQRNQREVETLIERLNRSGRNENNDAFLSLLQKLVESLELERDHVIAAVQQIKLVNDRRSDEFSRLVGETTTVVQQQPQPQITRVVVADIEEMEKRIQREVNARVENAVASYQREYESRVESDVNSRMSAIEGILRSHLEGELNSRTESIRRRFDDEVAEKVSQALGTVATVPVVTVDRVSEMLQQGGGEDAELRKYKTTLDAIFVLNKSIEDVVPMLPQYKLPDGITADYELMRTLHDYISYLLDKMRDAYKFIMVQSSYLYNIQLLAHNVKMPIDSLGRERAERFTQQVNNILDKRDEEEQANEHRVTLLLERMRLDLSQMGSAFEEFYRNRDFYRMNEQTLNEKDDKIRALTMKLDRLDVGLLQRERNEFEQLKNEITVSRTTIRELQQTVDEMRAFDGSTSYYKDPKKKERIAQRGELRLEVSLRRGLLVDFRRLYNELADYVIKLADEYKRWCRKNTPNRPLPELLRDYPTDINGLFDKSDQVINHGHAPRPKNDLTRSITGILHRPNSPSSQMYRVGGDSRTVTSRSDTGRPANRTNRYHDRWKEK